MPTYYFHLCNEQPIGDPEGTELPDVEAAWNHALAVAGELKSRSTGMLGHTWDKLTMSACDAEGKELFSFPMSQVTASKDGTPGKRWTLECHRLH